jgi:hypothetical protein
MRTGDILFTLAPRSLQFRDDNVRLKNRRARNLNPRFDRRGNREPACTRSPGKRVRYQGGTGPQIPPFPADKEASNSGISRRASAIDQKPRLLPIKRTFLSVRVARQLVTRTRDSCEIANLY